VGPQCCLNRLVLTDLQFDNENEVSMWALVVAEFLSSPRSMSIKFGALKGACIETKANTDREMRIALWSAN
jgi:hypothetical protein